MQLFECQHCGQLLFFFFENTRCERCGHALGYLPELSVLSALTPEGDGRWLPLAAADRPSRSCANAAYQACNWLVPAASPKMFCDACRLNRTVPNLGVPEQLQRWRRLEAAKHRLVYGLLRLGLPLVGKAEDWEAGLAFDFLAGPGTNSFSYPAEIMTGHSLGLITIDIDEADDAERKRHRQDMAEPFRTLLGHFRHEVGHYHWDRLVRNGLWLDAFRNLFGDERQDYHAALRAHYGVAHAQTGRSISSAATPAPIRGRILPRPGRTICILSTHWRPHTRSACPSARGPDAIRRSARVSTLILTARRISTHWSARGSRSPAGN